MARYDHLPIYRTAFDLAVHIEKIVRHFSRYHKYTVGTELRECSRNALKLIITANSQRGAARKATLLRLRQDLEWFTVLTRLCHESNAFTTTKAYLYVSASATEKPVAAINRKLHGFYVGRIVVEVASYESLLHTIHVVS
jgi:hypothetical protein